MSNFWQRKVAREDAGTDIVPDNTELPLESVEGVLSEVASDTAVIDQQDNEAALLTEDAGETEAQFDAVDADVKAADAGEEGVEEDIPEDAVEQIDVAQESVRRRWGLNNRQTCARESYGSTNRRVAVRESLWDDVKAFFRRIWEWLKAQGRKLKDRWINFHNQGKSIQKRSKKFDAAIRQLGSIKSGQDELKGGFIKSLTEGGTFVGNNVADLNNLLTMTGKTCEMIQAIIDEMTPVVDHAANILKADDVKHVASFKKRVDTVFASAGASTQECLGNMVLKSEGEDDDWNLTFVESDKDVPTEVKTPAIPVMNSINTFYNKLGIEVEKRAKAYEKTDASREKYQKAIEKLLNKVDKVDAKDNADAVEAIRKLRGEVSKANGATGLLERVAANSITCMTSGINGYLSAAIAAYDKRKS